MDSNYWRKRVSRRSMLRGIGTASVGLAGAALIGCGGEDSDSPATPGMTSTAAPGGSPAAGATTAPADAIRRGGTLRWGDGVQATPSLDPQTGNLGSDHKYFWTMFDGLVQHNPETGEPDPAYSLAESWEFVDDTTITFNLRRGVKFHNGEDFTAEAVKFTFDQGLDTDNARSSVRGQIGDIVSTEVVDEYTARIMLDRPNAALIAMFGDRGGQMRPPGEVERVGLDQFAQAPVGTGAFIFDEWVKDSHIQVRQNPEYWRRDPVSGNQVPYLDVVRWNAIPDAAVQQANLRTQATDIGAVGGSFLTEIEADPQFQVQKYSGTGMRCMFLDTTLAPTNDVNFRLAMAHAVDRQAMNTVLDFGQHEVLEKMGATPPSSWAYPGPVDGAPEFNLDEARARLAASAYPDGAAIKVVAFSGTTYSALNEFYQAAFAEIGIEMQFEQVQDATSAMWITRGFNAMAAGFSTRPDPDGLIAEVMHSEGFYSTYAPEDNLYPRLDELIEAARETYDLEERKELYRQVEHEMAPLALNIIVGYSNAYTAAQTSVQNLQYVFGSEGKQRYDRLWLDA